VLANMNPPPIDDSPQPPSYRDVLITRASPPRATRPILREFISSWALIVFLISCSVAIVKALYLKWLTSKSFAAFHPADWFGLLVFGFFVWLGFGVRRVSSRKRELMRNGEVAIASVASQANHASAKGGTHSWVTYSFEDAHGMKYQGACTDRTSELFKGMTFLVYYDREQPNRRVASCDSDFEVLLPNEE
jgi:hypothetical protein